MAEENTQENLEKTEEPTARRRDEARKQGQFAKSRNIIPAATLVAMALTMSFAGVSLIERLCRCINAYFDAVGTMNPVTPEDLLPLALQTTFLIGPAILPFFSAVLVAGLAAGFFQSGFVMASEPIRFDFSRVSPAAGFRRLFSIDAAIELVKAVVFIAVLGWLGGAYIYREIPALLALTGMAAGDMLVYASRDGLVLTAWVLSAMAILAALDYLLQRWRTDRQLRMSRQEVKQELREQEGDPLVKAHFKSLRQKLARRRMMADVAKADVVITNPTEFAVALAYQAGSMSAPRVLGKGAGFIAQKIREVARQKGIPIVENKPLARLLYRQVEVGREIPERLYRAVAEVLAYVYRLRRRNSSELTQPAFS
ncbi:MAG TPA: flagellar biosynthesis protein FlhB [Candidatus Binatia bacterium]|jgi:flagellar biosynthetic protein FlhB